MVEALLQRFLEAKAGAGVRVSDVQRLAGGYSQETYGFHAVHDGVEYDLILRRKPPSGGILNSDLGAEFRVIKAVRAAGYPAPEAHWLDETGEYLDQPGFVMSRIPGVAKPDQLFLPENAAWLRRVGTEIVDALGQLHAIQPERLPACGLAMPPAWRSYVSGVVDAAEAGFSAVLLEGQPLLAEQFRWLRRNMPEEMPLRLVHCDFQPGNIMYDETGVRGIIDWEMAHFGDPREDLGWLRAMGSLTGYEFLYLLEGGWINRYNAQSGLNVTQAGIDYFQVLRGLSVLPAIMANMKGFGLGEHHDIMGPYVTIGIPRFLNQQAAVAGISRARLGMEL